MNKVPKGWKCFLTSSYAGGMIEPDKMVCIHRATKSQFFMIRNKWLRVQYKEDKKRLIEDKEWRKVHDYCERRLLQGKKYFR